MTASKTLPAADVPDAGGRVSFVARQPILTADEKVFGYELLFRDGVENYFRETDSDSASRRTLDTSLQIGLEVLCDGRRGFVNCTRDVLLKDYMTLLPSTLAVAEVLESVPADDLVIAGLQRLKQAGYLIALDDFTLNDPRTPLTEMADIIKVDVRATKMEDCIAIAKKQGPWRCRLLAEKVEAREGSPPRRPPGLSTFRDISFAVRKFCTQRKSRPTD